MVEVEGLVGEDGKVEEDKVDGELDVSSVPELLASLGLHQLTRFESHLQFCLKTNFLTSVLELNGWDRLDKLDGLDRFDFHYLSTTNHYQDTSCLKPTSAT